MLNSLSRKAYTVVMVIHDRLPCVMDPDSPSLGYQPVSLPSGSALPDSEQPREAELAGPLVIGTHSPDNEPNRLNSQVNCTSGLFSRILVTPCYWARQVGSGFSGNTFGSGAIELFSRSSPRQGMRPSLDLGWRGGGKGLRHEAAKCWIRSRPAPV